MMNSLISGMWVGSVLWYTPTAVMSALVPRSRFMALLVYSVPVWYSVTAIRACRRCQAREREHLVRCRFPFYGPPSPVTGPTVQRPLGRPRPLGG